MQTRMFRSSFSVSIFIHVFFVLACFLLLQRQAQQVAQKPRLTWIELDPDQAIKRQLVQSEKGRVVDKAAPDAFLGERTQVVDRQTVSIDKMIEVGKAAKARTATDKAQASNPARQAKPMVAAPSLSNLGLALPTPGTKTAQTEQEAAQQEMNPQARSRTQDYVKGLKESEQTALNTREYVFFGYFQRIRERLDRAWVPILRQKLASIWRSGRHLASDMDHSTRVLVVLDSRGEIIRVQIIGESGTRDLDDAAVRAFNQAGPFPNPPKGIVDAKGEIQIPWEFVLRS